ncbi:MAG: hypothetical protein V4754_02770 [Pseudomonadota bacterium]
MKQLWVKLGGRVDALSLRERALMFAGIAGAILFVVYTMLLAPLYAKQKILLSNINQQQNQIDAINTGITQKLDAYGRDPDAANRQRLQALQADVDRNSAALRSVQKGLVPPEQMIPVLDQLLRGNGKLRLLSLRNLPVAGMTGGAFEPNLSTGAVTTAAGTGAERAVAADIEAAQAKAMASNTPGATVAAKPAELLYRHGVEITLQGSYLDMINYMSTLEALPAQLFWGKARLDAGHYPSATLTLTLYTLSLDQKWMTL